MQQLTLHHYGFLTASIALWLAENELYFGKPFKVFETVYISSQKVNIAFIQQAKGALLTELIEPAEENTNLKKMITKGITIYHTGYKTAKNDFDIVVKSFEQQGAHALPAFHSEAYGNNRCIFLVTKSLGMIEIIEE